MGRIRAVRGLTGSGGWTISTAINLQSGFPLNIQQNPTIRVWSGRQHTAKRPNIVPAPTWRRRAASRIGWRRPIIRPPPGSTRRAFTLAPADTFGNAPRTITDLRDAAAVQRRRRVHQELPAWRGSQGRSGEDRNAQHVQPAERARAAGREQLQQHELRPDQHRRPGSCGSRR